MFKWFGNDGDGFSQKDYLVLFSSLIFFGFVGIGLILILMGKQIDKAYMELLSMVATPFSVIIGGVFSVSVAQTIKEKKEIDKEFEYNFDEQDIYEKPVQFNDEENYYIDDTNKPTI